MIGERLFRVPMGLGLHANDRTFEIGWLLDLQGYLKRNSPYFMERSSFFLHVRDGPRVGHKYYKGAQSLPNSIS
jgi:hypothetical protein